MNIVFSILLAVLMFGLIIMIHELGHFITAKLGGIKVNEFAIGMGPTLLKRQKGETTYALRAVPIGGFVAMEGEDEDSADERAFSRRPVWIRILVVIAGALMNLVLGFVILIILTSASKLVPTTTVAKFDETSLSAQSGLQVGDEVLSINGRRIYIANDIDFELMRDKDGYVDMTVLRDGEKVTLTGVQFALAQDDNGNQFISRDFWVLGVPKTVGGVLKESALKTVSIGKMVWVSLLDLITGNVSISQVAGPVGTVDIINQAVSMGWETTLNMLALLTINVGIFNLLPIPALDGGRLVFLLIEAIRRKPIKAKYEGFVHAAGFLLLIGFMLFVTYSDITRIFAR